jgi:peptidyl-prolyl cis-trans isomerase D
MLQYIRDKAQSWIAFAIIVMLIVGLSTVMWKSYFSPDANVQVAKVNDEKITQTQFQRQYQQQRDRLQKMLGGGDISQFIGDEKEFKKNILKRMEDDELVHQAAVAAGYRVSDGLLNQQIRGFDTFQRDGKFEQTLYKEWLSRNFPSSGAFEELLRSDDIKQQYRMAIADTTWSTEQERNSLLKLQEQQRDVGYITVPASGYVAGITVSDDDAQAYYDNHKSDFATPEKVSISYLELSLADLSKKVDVDEEKLREQYQERKTDFGVPEQRRTRHILIEVAGDATEEEQKAAKDKAAALVKQLREGADFAKLARKSSDDIGSARDGGDLGYLTRDAMMDPAFADAAFALKKGEVSEPVKSAYGYHIIKLTGIKSGMTRSFAEVRDQLEQEYRRKQAEDTYFDQGETLANLTFENPDTLDVAAAELGLTVKTTPLFSRERGVGIAADNKVRDTAFSDDVLLEHYNSQPIDLDKDRVIVLRIKDHQESAIQTFEQVKQQIIAKLTQERAQAKAEEEGQAILKQLAEKDGIEALAKERKLTWTHPAAFKRNATKDVSRDVVEKAFRITRPDEGKTVYDGMRLMNGDYAVVALFKVIDGDPAKIDDKTRETMKTQRERYYGTNELLGAMKDMRSTAVIKEFPENL